MFKRFLTVGFLLGMTNLCACAHVERAGFDNLQHSARYCGNKHADENDVESAARLDCSPAQRFAVLRCVREQVGAKASTLDSGSGLSFTNTRATFGVCCDVQCGN